MCQPPNGKSSTSKGKGKSVPLTPSCPLIRLSVGVASSTPHAGSRARANAVQIDTLALIPPHAPPPAPNMAPENGEDACNEDEGDSFDDDDVNEQSEEVAQSQQPQLSQQQPKDTDGESHKILIKPSDIRKKLVLKYLSKIIMRYYTEAWANWTEVSDEGKLRYWTNFKAHFKWAREDEAMIKIRYKSRARKWLKNVIHRARVSNKQPLWIVDEVWAELKRKWSSEDYQKLREQNKKNRASKSNGSSTVYRGGSASMIEHKEKMEQKEGKELSMVEVFIRVNKVNGKWKDERARITHEKFLKIREERLAQAGEGAEINDDQLWLEVIRQNKDYCYGFGNLVEDVQPSLSQPAQSSISQQSLSETELKSMVNALEAKLEQQTKTVQEQIKSINQYFMNILQNAGLTLPPPGQFAGTMESAASPAPHASDGVEQPAILHSPMQQPTRQHEHHDSIDGNAMN